MSGLGTSGFGPSSNFRWSATRADGTQSTIRYPSPWWDVAHMDLPTTIKSLFAKCRYHALLNPLVASTVRKMSSYPITEIVIDDQPAPGFRRQKERWEDLLHRVLKIQQRQIDFGLNYHTFGNCIVSLRYPFFKFLRCPGCGFEDRIKRLRFRKDWDFKDFTYQLSCPKCGRQGEADVEDRWYRSYRDIGLIRWNPENIDIDFNPITQTTEYAYTIPHKIVNAVLQKKQRTLEEMPAEFIRAIKHRRPVILSPENVYHFKAPTPSLADNDEGWGYPPILPALKDSFYLQIMKKSQEAILLEQMVPLDIIFPTGNEQANPYTTINLADWKRRIEQEVKRWRTDPNHKPILPLPVGYQRIGGTGKALMLTQEIRAWSEHIIAGMNVPQEFVFGGLTWSGSSVSLRMLENQFLNYRDMHEQFLQFFLVPNVARFMGWDEVKLHMKQFRMADDVQAKQLLLQLNQLRKVSDKTTLSEFNIDANEELGIIEQELRRSLDITKIDTLMKAEIQGEAQRVMAKYQTKLQQEQAAAQQRMAAAGGAPGADAPPPGGEGAIGPGAPGPQPGEVNVIDLAEAWARKLSNLEPGQREAVLQRVAAETPQLHTLIRQHLAQADNGVDMRPLPTQRPPRRAEATL